MANKWVIGVDEAGTGAWASCFTVAAYACLSTDLPFLVSLGVRDSKKLSDEKRRELCVELVALRRSAANIQVVPVAKTMPQRPAWREAVARSVMHVISILGQQNYELLLDGKEDVQVTGYFARQWGLRAKFVVQGDDLHPTIGAASILAKTVRNDHLLDVAKQYPLHGFDTHFGYGTAAHLEAIALHGICAEHRPVKPLAAYFENVYAKPTET